MEALILFVLVFLACCAYTIFVLKPGRTFYTVWILAVPALGLCARLACLDWETRDYEIFLSVWFAQFEELGLDAFKVSVSNYNAPYLYAMYLLSKLPFRDLYLIKWLSVIFDAVLAFAALRLTAHLTRNKPLPQILIFSAVWFWPTFILNGAFWGQCDSIFTAFLLLALLYMLRDRPWMSVVMAGIAFSFKLQTIFFLPVYLIFLFAGRVRLKHALAFPAVVGASVIPALLLGMPVKQALGVYIGQLGISYELNYNAPSLYGLLPPDADRAIFYPLGLIAAAAFTLTVLALGWVFRAKLENRHFLLLSALLTIGIPYFLPAMHDRYFYPAEALILLTVLIQPKLWPAAALAALGSYGGYHAYLFQQYFLLPSGRMGLPALFTGAAFLLCCRQLYCELGTGENPSPPPAPVRRTRRAS